MLRNLLLVSILAFSGAATAQDRPITIVDPPERLAIAEKHTAAVDKAASLTADQAAEVNDMFLKVERQIAALRARMDTAEPKMSEEQKEKDMKVHETRWNQWTNDQLRTILTEQQMTKWMAAGK
ncbi:MAG: hypothetical protein WAU70_10190 [Flavobacteriales bacterium]